MKKSILLVFLLILIICPKSFAQEQKEFRFALRTNPLAALGGPLYVLFVPVTGEYKILFEAKTFSRQSVETGFSYLGPSLLINLDELTENDSIDGVKTSGYRFQFTYKFFLTKDGKMEGFYVGPHISFARAEIANRDNTEDEFRAAKLNTDILFGYQFITGGGFTMNMYTGLGFKRRDYDLAEDSNWDFDYGNEATPNVTFGFSFGVAF